MVRCQAHSTKAVTFASRGFSKKSGPVRFGAAEPRMLLLTRSLSGPVECLVQLCFVNETLLAVHLVTFRSV